MDQFPHMALAGSPALQSRREVQAGFFSALSLRAAAAPAARAAGGRG